MGGKGWGKKVNGPASQKAGSGGPGGQPAQNGSGVGSEAQILDLQRKAGNRATVGALAKGSLTTNSAALGELATGGAPGTSMLGKAKGAVSGSSFNAIRDALSQYEKATTPALKSRHLRVVSERATEWVNSHGRDSGAIDRQRRKVLVKLLDEVAVEEASLSKEMAQGIYLDNISNSQEAPDPKSKDPGRKHALKGLTPESRNTSKMGPRNKGHEFAAKHGLTEAEVAAVRIFTADDYRYINPGTKNDPKWLAEGRAKNYVAFGRGAADDDYMEEGRLHAGVMQQALLKLPADPAPVFRGATYTNSDFTAQVGVGKTFLFPSFASASKERDTAERFARDNGKDHAVIFRLRNSGGRDISAISLVGNEAEVTLMAGAKFQVHSITQIPPVGSPDGRTWHEVVLVP